MGDEVMLLLVIAEAESAVVPSEPLKDRLTAAMKKARGHWMVLDEDTQFRGAIGAVFKTASEDERSEIVAEFDGLRAVSALLSAVPVDLERVAEKKPTIGLLQLWHATKDS